MERRQKDPRITTDTQALQAQIESRLAAALAPLLAACGLAVAVTEWWPLALAGTMIGVGLAFEVALDRRLDYQPGWWSFPLAVAELGAIMGIVYALGISAPLLVALAFFAGSWLVNLILMHAVFPYLRLSYSEEGGELGRVGVAIAVLVLASLALSTKAKGTRQKAKRNASRKARRPFCLVLCAFCLDIGFY